jgi:hypothetical protein
MPKGRPLTHNAKNNKQYFVDYYHKTQEDVICECGSHIKLHSKLRHLNTKKHIQIIELINKNNIIHNLLKNQDNLTT